LDDLGNIDSASEIGVMERREVLQMLATGPALQLAQRKLLLVLGEALLGESDISPYFECAPGGDDGGIDLPRTDTPGAADVGAVEFLDLVLTEWSDEPERAWFLSGAILTKNHRGRFAYRYCGPCERGRITRSYMALTARARDYAVQQMKKGAL
jgi:hypothetical protein